MAVSRTQTSLLLSLLLMLLSLSFHVRVTDARLRPVVRISVPSSPSTPPSPTCGGPKGGIYHITGATEQPCRRPKRPSAANP